ncbi:aspartate ammonia-lyase [Bdellovibrio sp. NC01]|uniref:aspartate ammonia-lyase n=1 Tax=Bdellovibrio sp. NC01 TaxID=2220073 RepID=UPI001158E3BB|nr:aspartate ammonia-lyase [Bdellovibrio sp. NC01]QDK39399.1 aspartate ammonia-lyase [Bdellovibrio sp. NC01]
MKSAKGCIVLAGLLFLNFEASALPDTKNTAKPPASGRIEKDSLGDKQLPADAYYGVQTARALENFQISGTKINQYPEFINALAIVKLASARANKQLGVMKADRLSAIEKAVEDVRANKYHDQFVVDWFQGGAGTSTNMNVNEVLANIGLEKMGHKKGEYQYLHPLDDLNQSQSTNDVYPTAIKLALLMRSDKLIGELKNLAAAFRTKGNQFLEITKMGRTEMQDAVPMTVGQEFHAFAAGIESEIEFLKDAEKQLYTVNMGASAIGSGINVPKGYPKAVASQLAKLVNKPIVPAKDLFTGTWDQQSFVAYSSAMKSTAVKLSKIASDLILLASGPRAGLFEINLPAMQPGSSIMPGKVNPVIPELINVIAFKVMGNDTSITVAAHAGQLQLNAYEPVEVVALLESQTLLLNGANTFNTKCISGITVNEKVLEKNIESTVGIVTALNPIIGYEKSAALAKEAYKSGKGILEIIREQKILSEAQIKELLDPAKLTNLNKESYKR